MGMHIAHQHKISDKTTSGGEGKKFRERNSGDDGISETKQITRKLNPSIQMETNAPRMPMNFLFKI